MGGDKQPVPAKLEVVSGAVRVHEAGQAEALEEHGEAQRLGDKIVIIYHVQGVNDYLPWSAGEALGDMRTCSS